LALFLLQYLFLIFVSWDEGQKQMPSNMEVQSTPLRIATDPAGYAEHSLMPAAEQ